MNVSSDKSLPSMHRGSHGTEALLIREEPITRHQERMLYTDQLNLPPKVREVQQAGRVLAQIAEVRETRVVALRQDIEKGHYLVKAEQVAEKLVANSLLNLLY